MNSPTIARTPRDCVLANKMDRLRSETWQMSATGTYSDGSQKALTSGVVWSSSDATTVSVGQTSGIVTGLQNGSATISAASGSCSACSGSTTVTVALSGVTAMWGVNNSNAWRMVFDEVNAAGGINGRKIRYIVEDNQYQVPRSVQAANKLINRDGVFFMVANGGTPP